MKIKIVELEPSHIIYEVLFTSGRNDKRVELTLEAHKCVGPELFIIKTMEEEWGSITFTNSFYSYWREIDQYYRDSKENITKKRDMVYYYNGFLRYDVKNRRRILEFASRGVRV